MFFGAFLGSTQKAVLAEERAPSASADGFHWVRNIFHSQHLKLASFLIGRCKKISLLPLSQ